MRSLAAQLLLLALSIAPALGAPQANTPVLPTVSSYALSKERVTLPADFHGDRNLLLLSFRLAQQPDVDAWNAVIDHWRGVDPSLASYNSLVSQQKNFLSRWWQNASMRSALPDAKRWHTTIPLYVDTHAFEQALGISSEQQVVLLLTDRQGHVLSRVTGPPTDANRATIRAALESAGAPPGLNAAPPVKPQD